MIFFLDVQKQIEYPLMSQLKGWTNSNKQLGPTQTAMKISVMSEELPMEERFAAEVIVGQRTAIPGTRPENVTIRLWRDANYVTSTYGYGSTSVFKVSGEDEFKVEMEIKIPKIFIFL